MIKLIEASNFRSLKYIGQELGPFHVLIGANATGKTTFLEVLKFMSDVVSSGIEKSVFSRVTHFDELTFGGHGGDIELALEAVLPDHIQKEYTGTAYTTIRYELVLGLLPDTREMAIVHERLIVMADDHLHKQGMQLREEFPETARQAAVYNKSLPHPWRLVALKNGEGIATFTFEPTTAEEHNGDGWIPTFKLGTKKTALGNLPEDETKFPAATWMKSFLQNSIELFILDSQNMRKPSPAGRSYQFQTDGSNLPWVVESLRESPKKFDQWLAHIQTALPDVKNIVTIERQEDRSRYLKIIYENGIEVPSWLISDGTLRLLALTIPAYLPNFNGLYLIEEPENGIHPKAIEAAFTSLSSVYNAQIMLASHSPVILGLVKPEVLLCFAKTKEGVTDIVSGISHPKLRDWKGTPNLNYLFASGILS